MSKFLQNMHEIQLKCANVCQPQTASCLHHFRLSIQLCAAIANITSMHEVCPAFFLEWDTSALYTSRRFDTFIDWTNFTFRPDLNLSVLKDLCSSLLGRHFQFIAILTHSFTGFVGWFIRIIDFWVNVIVVFVNYAWKSARPHSIRKVSLTVVFMTHLAFADINSVASKFPASVVTKKDNIIVIYEFANVICLHDLFDELERSLNSPREQFALAVLCTKWIRPIQ